MMLSQAANEINQKFANTKVDSSVVMPDHVHLLFGLNLDDSVKSQDSVIDVVGWWKTITTKRYIEGVKQCGWPRFDGKLWQEGYHDRIVRDQRELDYIRYYIERNPDRWEDDLFHDR